MHTKCLKKLKYRRIKLFLSLLLYQSSINETAPYTMNCYINKGEEYVMDLSHERIFRRITRRTHMSIFSNTSSTHKHVYLDKSRRQSFGRPNSIRETRCRMYRS